MRHSVETEPLSQQTLQRLMFLQQQHSARIKTIFQVPCFNTSEDLDRPKEVATGVTCLSLRTPRPLSRWRRPRSLPLRKSKPGNLMESFSNPSEVSHFRPHRLETPRPHLLAHQTTTTPTDQLLTDRLLRSAHVQFHERALSIMEVDAILAQQRRLFFEKLL